MGRLNNGEKISGISAILLFVFMFFNWFSVKDFSNPNPLLIDLQGSRAGVSAWEALDYIPIVLLVTIIATLAMVMLSPINATRKSPLPVNRLVAIFGVVSMLLILYRIIVPPSGVEEEIIMLGGAAQLPVSFTWEGTAQLPMFLALLSATGIAFGGCLAVWEEGFSLSDLRARRGGAPE